MKTTMKRAIRDERGAGALTLVLILLVVGGLILTPLLGLMSTGLMAGQAYERHTDRLYAADAGVEDAIWKIQTNNLAFDPATNWSQPWHITANGKNVTVVAYRYDWDWTCGENFTYQILSTVISDDGGGVASINSTTIDAHLIVSYADFSFLLDNAIISDVGVTFRNDVHITGNVTSGGEVKEYGQVSVNGTIKEYTKVTWPTEAYLLAYYWEDVAHLETEAYPDGYVVNIPPGTSEEDPYIIGPLLAAGDLTIKGNGWLALNGTIYVKGSLFINPTPEIHLDLKGHTIFVENEIDMNPGSPGDTVTLHDSGCIIAVGNIDFRPNQDSDGDDFVLVMSVTGNVFFNPNSSFTGCIAGNADVTLQPGNTISWIDPENQDLNFPADFDPGNLPPVTGLSIESWEINPE